MKRSPRTRSSKRCRRGSALMAALALVMLLGALLASWFSDAVTRQRQVKLRGYELQAAWLAEAGLEQAAARLAAAPDAGSFQIDYPAERLRTAHAARVQVEIAEAKDDAGARRVRVTAIYPADTKNPVQVSKRVRIDLAALGRRRAEGGGRKEEAESGKPAWRRRVNLPQLAARSL